MTYISTPTFKTEQAADIARLPKSTLAQWVKRELMYTKSIAPIGHGRARLWTGRQVLEIATAAVAAKVGLSAKEACLIGATIAHTGGPAGRLPAVPFMGTDGKPAETIITYDGHYVRIESGWDAVKPTASAHEAVFVLAYHHLFERVTKEMEAVFSD